jgi:hypothetical protein
MSQPNTHVTNCAKCGRPKAPPVTTNQAPGEAKWPTYWADIQYTMQKILDARKGEPVTINGQRMGVPDLPQWIPTDEQAPPVVASPYTSFRTHAATQPPSEPFMIIPPPPWVPTDKQEGPTIF